MGLLDKVSDGLKKGVQSVNDEIKRRQEIKKAKYDLLEKFTIYDIKKMNRDYGIGQPPNYEEDYFTGERTRITLDRDDYVDHAIENLTLEQIKHFAEKKKNKISNDSDKFSENTKVSPPTSDKTKQAVINEKPEGHIPGQKSEYVNQLDSILSCIENEFEPEDVRDEKEFEKQLVVFLKSRYPDKVERQYVISKCRVDILIDRKYALELKIANRGALTNLIGQVRIYKKVYPNLAVIILDINKLPESEIREYIKEYQNAGTKTLLIKGELNKKRKNKQINIRL